MKKIPKELTGYVEHAPKSLSDVLQFEVDMRWTRESGVLAPTTTVIPLGAVLGKDDAGRYVSYMQDITPEGEGVAQKNADKAVAVLISRDIPVSEVEQHCTVVVRGCTVTGAQLAWLESVTTEQKTQAYADLRALGIVPTE